MSDKPDELKTYEVTAEAIAAVRHELAVANDLVTIEGPGVARGEVKIPLLRPAVFEMITGHRRGGVQPRQGIDGRSQCIRTRGRILHRGLQARTRNALLEQVRETAIGPAGEHVWDQAPPIAEVQIGMQPCQDALLVGHPVARGRRRRHLDQRPGSVADRARLKDGHIAVGGDQAAGCPRRLSAGRCVEVKNLVGRRPRPTGPATA